MDERKKETRARFRVKTTPCQWPTFWILTGCLICLLIMDACTSRPHLVIYQANHEFVDLREWPVGYLEQPHHSHPQSISIETIQQVLRSIFYRESVLFSFLLGKPKHLFTTYQVERLGRALPQAFEQALPQEVIAFRIRSDTDSARYTSGFCFIAGDEIHFVLDAIQMPAFQAKDTLPRLNAARTELVPQSGQRLFSRDTGRKGTKPNWVVIQLASPKEPVKL